MADQIGGSLLVVYAGHALIEDCEKQLLEYLLDSLDIHVVFEHNRKMISYPFH